MWRWMTMIAALMLAFAMPAGAQPAQAAGRTFSAHGVVLDVRADAAQLVIRHEAIVGYMDGMTMPFKVKDPAALTEFKRGDRVNFQLHVTADESWVDHVQKTGVVSLPDEKSVPTPVGSARPRPDKSLLDYKFTDELGRATSFNDFRGQALAITFFYTRCPLPEYCPRLSMNFKEALQKLEAMPNAPTNWHFISVTFDPGSDTPQALKSYGETYGYDPAHWSFFTGPEEKIAGLARGAGVQYEPTAGVINHNFRTLIIDPAGHLQTVFPVSGNLSDQIVSEILKATARKGPPPISQANHQQTRSM